MLKRLSAAIILGLAVLPAARAEPPVAGDQEIAAFRDRLLAATTKHLNSLMDGKGVTQLKGKSADGFTALAYYQLYEATGDLKYRDAAVLMADRILKDMRATAHGVLYIKEKPTGDKVVSGGGPPAFGWYTAAVLYILHKEGQRDADIKYVATVIDKFPWNEKGWWANTIDIKTGQPKEPLEKAGAINKSAAMALCAAMAGVAVKATDPQLSAKLKAKADTCIYKQVIPAQEPDGFWHYGFSGNDPKEKDVIGYFMVTAESLIQLQHLTGAYRDKDFQAALDKACGFAAQQIAPMTEPNRGPVAKRAGPGTPPRYDLAKDTKRGFELGPILFAGRNYSEGIKIMDASLKHFAPGNVGMDGAHAVGPSAMILSLLKEAKGR